MSLLQGCDYAVAICSVGSLKSSLPVGSLLVADDFWCPHDLRRVYTDYRAHFMPAFSEPLRKAIVEIVKGAGFHPAPAGVYVNATGPRFETKAEIRQMATVGDVVGMTAAHECSACCEVGLPYALLGCVDNFANGLGPGDLTVDDFKRAQHENMVVVEKCVDALLSRLPARSELVPAVAVSEDPAASPSSAASSSKAAASGSSTAVDLLVHARWIVPVASGKEQEVLQHHSLAVSGGKIVAIVPTPEATGRFTATRVVTLAEKHVVMPGLVNAHTHLPLNLLKGVADDMPLLQWLTEQIWPTEGRLVSPEFVAAGTRAGVAECIRSGVTCINDMYFYPGATAEVLESSGLRGTVSAVALEFPMGAYASNAGEYLARGLEARAASLARGAGNGRVSWALGPHAPYTVSDGTFEKVRDMAHDLQCRVNLHLHETSGEVTCSCMGTPGPSKHLSDQKCSPVDNLHRLGLLGPQLIAVHMTCLTDDEIAKVASTGTHVVHCPHSNLKLASGFCPVAKLLNAGVNVALGTDSASSNNALDMFAEMKTAAVLAKAVAGDATALPAWQALRMATLNGAIALGGADKFGSLEAGKEADFIAVELDEGSPESGPMYNVLSHLVYASGRHMVTDVWVQGSQLMAERKLLTIDEGALRKEMAEWSEKVRPTAAAKAE